MSGVGRSAWAIIAICVLASVTRLHVALAQDDHRLVFRTLHTEHFDIHYHEPLGLLARDLAAKIEAIHARLSASLGLSLDQRVQLVLSDNDDAANGLAGPLPYNTIRLRAVAPDDMSPLGDYDDWPTLLATHEHTHILQLEEASGLPRLVQRIFGRVYTPQQFLPGFLVEGLAVAEETAQTSGGRGRDSLFDMYLRMDALDDRILGLDWIGFDGEPWPHGNVRYLYGGSFVSYIAEKHGFSALGQFTVEYGKRLVPYGISRAMKRATGKTVAELYEEWKADLRTRSLARQREVLARGLIEGQRLTFHGETTRSPRFVDDRHVVYAVTDQRHVTSLRSLDVVDERRAPRELARTTTPANSAHVPGAERILFSAVDYHRGAYAFDDLFIMDGDGSGRRRLTHGLRAREPDVARDGHTVVFVVHGAGTSHLELAELDDVEGTRRPLVTSRRLEQVFTPRFSPDGRKVAYSAWSRGGFRDIWTVDVDSGARLRNTNDRAIDRGPVFSPDGRTLYFASDRTGISNLYAFDLESHVLRQITNVVGGAFQPDVSPDGKWLVYAGYSSQGFDLMRLPVDPDRSLSPLPSFARPSVRAQPEPLAAQSEAYEPLKSLGPRTWDASLDEGSSESRLVLTTSGADAVGIHAWSLAANIGLETGALTVTTGYSYQRARFPLLISTSVTRNERFDLVSRGTARPWQALSYGASLGTNLRFPYGIHAFAIRPDFSINRVEPRASFDVALDPNDAPPRLPYTGRNTALSVTFRHANAQRQAYDISQSWGHAISVRPTLRDRWIGSRDDELGISYRAEQFFRFDVREGVLAMAYTGAYNVPATIGGFPAQLAPIFDVITQSAPAPADIARLRGFPGRSGTRLNVLQLEARMLVVRVNRGFDTLPVFARRLHAALFMDTGDAYEGRFQLSRLGVGVGGELRFDASTSYGEELTLRFGIAQGLTEGGELQWYTSVARPY